MILRIQSPIGTKRIECQITDSTAFFFQKVKEAFELDSVFDFTIFKNREKTWEVHSLERKSLSFYNLKHGDMLFMAFKDPSKLNDVEPPSPLPSTSSASNTSAEVQSTKFLGVIGQTSISTQVVEDEVDKILYSQDGYIQRKRDKVCQHGAHAKCVHCAPIEPYNDSYLHEHNIKHMSFHSYLRKVTGGIDKGKFAALENISCKIKPGCREHVPWPHGICTKCQPNAVTLNRQVYRHTDNVVSENAFLVERFLDFWRNTGNQRMGFLYGRYEVHKDVPLGIKAIVVAVYEPPQENGIDYIRLTPDSNREVVDEIATRLGLQQVGWIFTDLIAEDLQKGTVKHLRGADSYFLSAQECIMAGHLQSLHPNACRFSPDGYFGSKFVTLCVTGDKDNRVHLEGYQISNQCMALVRDKCLVPTKDRPELGYVRESTNKQYVPDVFYKIKDNYGNEVTELARPLPIEYLLVDVPVSTPNEPCFTFYANASIKPFPVENRYIDGQIQDFGALASYLCQFKPEQFLEAVSDFHVLLYIATMDTLPLRDAMEPLLDAVRTKNRDLASQWARSEQWATVEQIISAQGMDLDSATGSEMNVDQPSVGAGVMSSQASAMWTCRHCTFLNNSGNSACEICGLPQ